MADMDLPIDGNDRDSGGGGSSAMRRAITRAMDAHDRRSRYDRIIAKRGAMKWLPVLGSNDLIHGSWWFVVGSIGVVLTSVCVVVNKFDVFLGTDDSTLSDTGFTASWILLAISGVFSTLASLAFVRAFHEDPPMKPLFPNHYHFQSDELLASWMFFFACFPFIPYCLIYLSASSYHSIIYIAGLGFAIAICLGTLVFVRACYPSDNDRVSSSLSPAALSHAHNNY